MKKVICIVGPTGSGKTSLSVNLATKLGAEIINADSVSMYERLDIGSAKIKEDEMQGIPHHLISHVKLGQNYTVYNFQQDVRKLLSNINIPIIVGGSGLYIKSALYNYEFEHQNDMTYPSLDEMIKVILDNDPNITIDFGNTRRIESAYRTINAGQQRSLKTKKNDPIYDIHLIYLDVDRATLKNLIKTRLDVMIENGFIEETKNLIEHDLNIIGYREIKAYLNGTYTLDVAKEEIIRSTMRFAKRQKTWFLNQMTPIVYDALDPNLLVTVMSDIKVFLGVHNL